MRVRIGDAGVDQRRHAKGEQPRRLGNGLRFEPARHGEDAGRRQRIQENAPAFTRIQPVLGQRERPGAGRRPGIDERHLQDVELLTGAGQVRAGFVVHEPDARGIDDPGECPVALGDGTEQDPVDLDAGHRRIAERQAGQDVAAAADADDAGPAIPQLVRQRGDVVLRPPELVCRALPLGNRRAGHAVDRRPRHSGRELRRLVGAAPEKHMTLGRHLNDHIRVGVPPGEIDDGSQEPQVTALRVDRAKRMCGRGVQHGHRHQHDGRGRGRKHPAVGPARETQRADGRARGGDKRRRRDVRVLQNPDDEQASAGGAEQVRAVQLAHRARGPGQRERNRDA